jgi:tetratricopeptide (TPR) repeat protein
MQGNKLTFEVELDHLLKQYFGEEDLNRINLKINPPKEEYNRISEMINDFYRDQLDINVDSSNERIKIDRTITFSEKQLKRDKFCNFLLDLGRLCISSGRLNLAGEIFRKTNKTSDDIWHKAESLLELANVFSRRADWPRSLVAVSDAELLYEKNNDNLGKAKCFNLLGTIYGERGDIVRAKTNFQMSLSLIDPESDMEMLANLNTNLGIIYNIQGNSEEAKVHLKNALVIYKKLGNQKRIAEINYNIGMTFSDTGEYESAIEAFDEGIEIAKKGRLISVLCLIYLAKSHVLIAQDDIISAAAFVDKALELSHNVDDKLTFADICKLKGMIERRLKNYKTSESFLLNSLRINKNLKNEMNIAETSIELALLYKEIEKPDSRESYLGSALKYFKQIHASRKVKEIETMLGIEPA